MLQCFTLSELQRLVRRQKRARTIPRSRVEAVRLITRLLDLAEIVDAVRAGLGRPAAGRSRRLDAGPARHGEAVVRVRGRADVSQGELRLERPDVCIRLRLSNVQLFLENLWPVLADDAGEVPRRRTAGRKKARPEGRAYVVDEGDYELRNGRLRLKLARAGPVSFRVEFLRRSPRTRRPQYLLEPIA